MCHMHVLIRRKKSGLKLSPEKCHLFQDVSQVLRLCSLRERKETD